MRTFFRTSILLLTGVIPVGLAACSSENDSSTHVGVNSSGVDAATTIVSAIGGKCLDDAGGATTNYNKIQLYTCNGKAEQSWTIEGAAIVGIGGKCLDLRYDEQVNGNIVWFHDCNESAAQKWTVDGDHIKTSDGYCLDVRDGVDENGTQIDVTACSASQSQVWHLTAPSKPDAGGGSAVGPLASDAVVDAIGFDLGTCTYNFPDASSAFKQSLAFLKAAHVRHLRQNFVNCEDQTELLNNGVSEAIGTTVAMTVPEIEAKLAAVPTEYLPLIDYIEPQNEYDTCHSNPGWEDPVVQNIKNIRAARDSKPEYASIKVAGLGACNTNDDTLLKSYDLGAITDLVTVHDGFGYGAPDQNGQFAAKTNLARSVYRDDETVYWTESGYCDAMSGDEFASGNCMSDRIISHYGPREVLTALQNKVQRVYFDFLGDHPLDGGFQAMGWIDQNGNVKEQGYTWMNLARSPRRSGRAVCDDSARCELRR